MRRIARHPKYKAKLQELKGMYPNLPEYARRLEHVVATNPGWPISIFVAAYEC
ncbi:MAG: hypothetical protein H8E66_14910 [Planctomycetes bacterium]|nr:hypothetical protein [Planctomycetota bacterium]